MRNRAADPAGHPAAANVRVAIREVINGVMYILDRLPVARAAGFAAQKHRA